MKTVPRMTPCSAHTGTNWCEEGTSSKPRCRHERTSACGISAKKCGRCAWTYSSDEVCNNTVQHLLKYNVVQRPATNKCPMWQCV